MGTRNPSAPPRAQSADTGDAPDAPAKPRFSRRARPHADRPSGVTHDNTRHTARFTVIGNHLAQHAELSLLAIGLAVHIQSLRAGTPVDIKTLTGRFPEGATRIAAALNELETHGYLRRQRERTPTGRIITRTTSCNQPTAPAATGRPHPRTAASPRGAEVTTRVARLRTPVRPPTPTRPQPDTAQATVVDTDHADHADSTDDTTSPHTHQRSAPHRRKHPLPPVPQPGFTSPELLQRAFDFLTGLRCHDIRLTLSDCDTTHLAPGVAAWLERDIHPDALRHALATGLPSDGPRDAAQIVAYRLITQLPPPPPFRPQPTPAPVIHPFETCDACGRAFRSPEPGLCRDCRPPTPPTPLTAGLDAEQVRER